MLMNWILGSAGFIGEAISDCLENQGIPVERINRQRFDFKNRNEVQELAKLIKSDDTIIFLVGIVPCRDDMQLIQNVSMLENLTESLSHDYQGKFVYVSSDSVYSDSNEIVLENYTLAPNSIHGQMHLFRERIVLERFKSNFLILRPTNVYGKYDPHNSYGPNRFIRQIMQCQPISLIGKGEEIRDHIHVSEVSEAISQLVQHNAKGIFNISTGQLFSFREIAERVINHFECKNVTNKLIYQNRISKEISNPVRNISNSKLSMYLPKLAFTEMTQHWTNEYRK